MGASSSTDNTPPPPLNEEESLAASTASLPALRSAFSNLAHPNPDPTAIPLSSLHATFSLDLKPLPSDSPIPHHLSRLLPHLGPSIASQFFTPTADLDWIDFLRGYNRCCARIPASESLNNLLTLYSSACRTADIPCQLEPHNDIDDSKVDGCLAPADLLTLLLACWIMARASHKKGGGDVVLPDVSHLVVSAFVSSGVIKDEDNVWEFFDGLGSDVSVSVEKFHAWVLATAPGISYCLSHFVQESLKACAESTGDMNSISSAGDSPSCTTVQDKLLLTCGRAWSISLTLRNSLGEELLGACFPGIFGESLDNILYRSSIHGKGLTRFWSNVEGYHGPVLILISAYSNDGSEGDSSARKWVIGMLTEQGFENRDTFYGNSGHLFAISPTFHAFPPSGKDKNFVYCHLHPTVRVYEPKPKPFALAFGGTIENERILIDEDFARVTIRHHACDKTYQPGSLIPNQGYLTVEASLLEAEVWGFGGKAVKEKQDAYKKREDLFSEQRRKVDLKTFGWEDSPEKAMMDMVSDPNRVQREDR